MSNLVFVLNTEKRPLLPVHPGKAPRLLNAGKAAVFRRDPFTIYDNFKSGSNSNP